MTTEEKINLLRANLVVFDELKDADKSYLLGFIAGLSRNANKVKKEK
jgi:hypothetical protein